jgi:hypothetical protein
LRFSGLFSNFKVQSVNRVGVADVAFLASRLLALCSCAVEFVVPARGGLGHEVRLDQQLSFKTLQMTIVRCRRGRDYPPHGSTAPVFAALCTSVFEDYGMLHSMRPTGNRQDNAGAESFFSPLGTSGCSTVVRSSARAFNQVITSAWVNMNRSE